MTTADRIRELIEPIVADLGAELFDLEFSASQLKVTLDRPGGVDMQAVAAATRAISRALDDSDPIAGHYTLEVSSPGLERALRTPAHFSWAIGQSVAIKTRPTYEGDRRITGTISAADESGFVVAVDDPSPRTQRLAYDEIDKARTVFVWGGAPKPGGRASRRDRDASAKHQAKTRTKRAKAS